MNVDDHRHSVSEPVGPRQNRPASPTPNKGEMHIGGLLCHLLLGCGLLGCTLLGCKAGHPWMGNPFASTSHKLVLPDPPAQWASKDDDGQRELSDPSDQKHTVPSHSENVQLVTARGGNASSAPVLVIDGVRPEAGTIRIALFESPQGFPDRSRASHRFEMQPSDTQLQLLLPTDLRGAAAIAVFQDLDDNGGLNRGAFGIPQEPFGFSGEPSSTMGPPSFADATVSLGPAQASRIHVQLN